MTVAEDLPLLQVDVVEKGGQARRGRESCELGSDIRFRIEALQTYNFTTWSPVVFDALVLAAAVEFCDMRAKRPKADWGRAIELRVPVHDIALWSSAAVTGALTDALNFLTGDQWTISFIARKRKEPPPPQGNLDLPDGQRTIIPFSEGLDSRAVGALIEHEIGHRLIRVRLGSKKNDRPVGRKGTVPFTALPYKVHAVDRRFRESTARSRGFKFAMVSALAAYLIGTDDIVVPESGQGALGPVLAATGQAHKDYRNHPLFFARMQVLMWALLRHQVRYRLPRLWNTKGETLAEFARIAPGSARDWHKTRSCWQQNRHVSVHHKRRQCGICAACMLRRMSAHAASLEEPQKNYIWEDLTGPDFQAARAKGFAVQKVTQSMRHYAIAGALHLDHLAALRSSPLRQPMLRRNSMGLADALGLPLAEVESKLHRMLQQHELEWTAFMQSLGPKSFVTDWLSAVR